MNVVKASAASKIEKEQKRAEKKRMQEILAPIEAFLEECYAKYREGNYKTGTICGNMIGDRIRCILQYEEMSVVELSEETGIGRSSLQRYLEKDCYKPRISKSTGKPDKNSQKFIFPKAITLYKILQALQCSVDDFVHSPDNFNKWENDYLNKYEYTFKPHETPTDYLLWKENIKSSLKRRFVYGTPQGLVLVPKEILDILTRQIFQAIETTDVLLEYAKQTSKPKGSYRIEIIETD